jgi:hypothetical protein
VSHLAPVHGLWLLLLGGALAGWLVGTAVPQGIRDGGIEFHRQPYLTHWEQEPWEVSDARPLTVPWVYGDFDLQMDVELAAGVTLDLLLRRVELRQIGNRLEPFHGRFTTLRLSADRGGEPWFARERLLLGDRDAAGAELASGVMATVWVAARGRQLEGNVAGRRLPPFVADDVHGSFVLVARGGTATVKTLHIHPRGVPPAWLWSPWTWLGFGMLGGLLLWTGVLAFGGSALAGGLGYAGAAWLAVRWLAGAVPPLWHPPPAALLALLGAATCCALVGVGRRRCRWLWPAVALGLLWLVPPLHLDEGALDRLFGPCAGSALVEAHAQRVRSGSEICGIHDVAPVAHRVFLLGGELVYGLDAPERHLELLLTGGLRVAMQARVDVPCLATADGWSGQQWALFERFYQGYRPDVIVLGIAALEGDPDPATGTIRSRPGDLARTIAAARAWCAAHDAHLVLFAAPGVAGDYLDVLRQAAAAGLPLVTADPGDDRPEQSLELGAVIAPLRR